MKKEINIIEQFDHLGSIEPSPEWSNQLFQRLDQRVNRKAGQTGRGLVLFAILLLLAINVFSLSKSWMDERSQQYSTNVRTIASDFLITTNSSQY